MPPGLRGAPLNSESHPKWAVEGAVAFVAGLVIILCHLLTFALTLRQTF
jgi:hypothetical protein